MSKASKVRPIISMSYIYNIEDDIQTLLLQDEMGNTYHYEVPQKVMDSFVGKLPNNVARETEE